MDKKEFLEILNRSDNKDTVWTISSKDLGSSYVILLKGYTHFDCEVKHLKLYIVLKSIYLNTGDAHYIQETLNTVSLWECRFKEWLTENKNIKFKEEPKL